MTQETRPPLVSIVPAAGALDEQVERLIALAGAGDVVQPGDAVLLKPNLHAPMHYATASTVNPAMAAALVRWCRRKGAARVVVGDGPFYGCNDPRAVFTQTGVARAVEEAGAEWVLFDEHEFRLFDIAEDGVPTRIGVTRFAFDCTKMINFALLKTHLDTMVTLGLKNLKGCIRPQDKAAFHKGDITRSLTALNRILKADLTLIDGTLGMEGMGPATGRVVNFGHLFAGRDVLAVDTVAAAAMGFGPDELRLHRFAREAGIGCGDPALIRVAGENLAAIARRFERPYEEIVRAFGDMKIVAEHACSGCKLSVFRALKETIAVLKAGGRVAGTTRRVPMRTIVLGRGGSDDPHGVFIGRCAAKAAGARRHLAGCPPALDAVKAFLVKCAQEP